MTRNRCTGRKINLQGVLGTDKDSFKELLREVLQEVWEQEMTDAVGAEKGERRKESRASGARSFVGAGNSSGTECGPRGGSKRALLLLVFQNVSPFPI
jgi:hypothetical protein